VQTSLRLKPQFQGEKQMRKFSLLFVIVAFSAIFTFGQNITQGELFASGKSGQLGECPLKHTSVTADISGFLARVTVTQEFENDFTEPIEAVYTFPLSQNSAVDAMTMHIGERTIRGQILKREDAKKVYEQAKTDGKTASLLDQERANIFTQSVANILPNEKIVIEISYVETLKYEDGSYEFVFPMTVGPRYIPGSVNAVEAQKISPPVALERAGHDISIDVNLDAGVPVEGIISTSHPIATTNLSSSSAKISLRDEKIIPNKDFILRYDVTGKRIEDAILTHRAENGGFFSLILSPPDNFAQKDITPKEIVFVLDTSGSMSGFPIEKAKEAMRLSLENLNPQDTFNLITFAGDTSVLFDAPVPATSENLARAKAFLETRQGGGGTEMMKAIRAALDPSDSQKHLRVVCFMTDGYVGNEAEIIGEIQKHPNARVFSFGIGNSVNRLLLDKMAEEGLGEVEYVALTDDGSKAAKKFYERVRTPLLTDISIDWNGLPVDDVYPKRIGDLFSAKPVILGGRYTKGAKGTIRLKGKVGGQPFVRNIFIDLPENEPDHDVLATLWARRRIDNLTAELYKNAKDEKAKKEIQEQITSLGIEFRLLTQFTSFIAVEERVVNQNGQPTRVEVPVERPDGTDSPDAKLRSNITNQVVVAGRVPSGTTFTSLLKTAPNVRSEPLAGGFQIDGSSGAENVMVIDGAEVTGFRTGQLNSNNALPPITAIFKRMDEHQKALKSLLANITMTKFDSVLSQTETSEGTVKYLPQADNYALRIDWTKPKTEILSIVKDRYVFYQPALKTAITGKTGENQKNVFLTFSNLTKEKLKENYSVKYLGEEKVSGNISAWHLELTPKTASNYKTAELWVDGNGMIIQVKLTENNGDWSSILLSNPQKNVSIGAADFKIDLPKETKIARN
jgi:Ca-activated chloride channel family protein